MRESGSFLAFFLTLFVGMMLVASILLTPDIVAAQEAGTQILNSKTCLSVASGRCTPPVPTRRDTTALALREGAPSLEGAASATPLTLTRIDAYAALRTVQFALSNVGDGGRYVWYRLDRRFRGVIQPTASFRDDGGRVCRHVVVRFEADERKKSIETVACRRLNGVWELSG